MDFYFVKRKQLGKRSLLEVCHLPYGQTDVFDFCGQVNRYTFLLRSPQTKIRFDHYGLFGEKKPGIDQFTVELDQARIKQINAYLNQFPPDYFVNDPSKFDKYCDNNAKNLYEYITYLIKYPKIVQFPEKPTPAGQSPLGGATSQPKLRLVSPR